MRLNLIYFWILLFCGCSAPKSALRYTETTIGVPDKDKSVVIVYRRSVAPLIFPVGVYFDGDKKASLPNSAFTWFYVEPGSHRVEFKWPTFSFQAGTTKEIDVVPGQIYYVQLKSSMHFTGGIKMVAYNVGSSELVARQKAESDLKKCCKYIPVK